MKYQSNVLGISVTYEKNDRLQDFTICPWFYNKNLQIEDITANSGHSVEDVMKTLPSINSMILAIMKGDLRKSASKGAFKMLYTPYKNSQNILDQSTWVESIRRNELPPNNLLRCATIEWPNAFQLHTNSYVSLNYYTFLFIKSSIIQITVIIKVMLQLNSSVVKLMRIQFHDRGNAEILTNPTESNFLSLVFPLLGR